MLRQSETTLLAELAAFEEDPALFDPSPVWSVPGLRPSLREDEEDGDGLGLRSLLERPESLSKVWRTPARTWSENRARRSKLRHSRRSSSGSRDA